MEPADVDDAGLTDFLGAEILSWLAGLLEGEGSFLCPPPSAPATPRVQVEMTDRDIVERVAGVFTSVVAPLRPRREHYKPSYRTLVRGYPALAFMRALYPHLGLRRKTQVEAAIAATPPSAYTWLLPHQRTAVAAAVKSGRSMRSVALELAVAPKTVQRLFAGPHLLEEAADQERHVRLLQDTLNPLGPDMCWLAGYLEGEGSFLTTEIDLPRVCVRATDRDVIVRAGELMGVARVGRREARQSHWSPTYEAAVSGAVAGELMRTLLPALGARRSAAVRAALDRYDEKLRSPGRRCGIDAGAGWRSEHRASRTFDADRLTLDRRSVGQQIIDAFLAGDDVAAIGATHGKSIPTVYQWLQRMETTTH